MCSMFALCHFYVTQEHETLEAAFQVFIETNTALRKEVMIAAVNVPTQVWIWGSVPSASCIWQRNQQMISL